MSASSIADRLLALDYPYAWSPDASPPELPFETVRDLVIYLEDTAIRALAPADRAFLKQAATAAAWEAALIRYWSAARVYSIVTAVLGPCRSRRSAVDAAIAATKKKKGGSATNGAAADNSLLLAVEMLVDAAIALRTTGPPTTKGASDGSGIVQEAADVEAQLPPMPSLEAMADAHRRWTSDQPHRLITTVDFSAERQRRAAAAAAPAESAAATAVAASGADADDATSADATGGKKRRHRRKHSEQSTAGPSAAPGADVAALAATIKQLHEMLQRALPHAAAGAAKGDADAAAVESEGALSRWLCALAQVDVAADSAAAARPFGTGKNPTEPFLSDAWAARALNEFPLFEGHRALLTDSHLPTPAVPKSTALEQCVRVLRAAHTLDLEVMQRTINASLARLQDLTATCTTDARLGRVGR